MKKCLIILLALMLAVTGSAEMLVDTAAELSPGSVGGEWAVIALSRGGVEVPEECFEGYLARLNELLESCGGVLHQVKYTEYSRTVLALASLGENPADFAGYNLIAPLTDVNTVKIQGINGPIWALIALDSGDYEGVDAARSELLAAVLAAQNEDGGYSLIPGDASGADLTAMAIVAMSLHMEDAQVADAVERAVECLSAMTLDTCESCAQALTAYSTLGMTDEAAKVRAMLNEYAFEDGYRHLKEDAQTNTMATEQACYAIAANERMLRGANNLFDMRDAE